MINSIFKRFLLIPMLFFLGFAGSFCVIEYRSFMNDDQMKEALNDPVLSHIFVFERYAWAFEALLDKAEFQQENDNGRYDAAKVLSALTDLKQAYQEIAAYFMGHAVATDSYLNELDMLRSIEKSITDISKALPEGQPWDNRNWEEAEVALIALMQSANDLNMTVLGIKQREATGILDKMAMDEKQRALLVVFVLVAGFALVLVLLDAVYHYKANAERAEAAEKVNAIFAAALQNTRVGVLIRDMRSVEKSVVFINNAFSRMTGYQLEDIKGNSTGFLFGWHTEQASIRNFHRAVQSAEGMTQEVMLYRKDGAPFWAEWNLTPLVGEDGQLTYFVSIFNDISSIRQTQDDLIQAKLLAEQGSAIKTNFLAMMSHEIRTPINGILGVMKLLGETRLDAEQRHLLDIAVTSSGALHGIINDILDYAKMEAGKIEIFEEAFSMQKMLGEIQALAKSLVGDKEVDLVFDVSAGLPALLNGDSGRLRQVVLNLVSNAIKFTEKGFVRVRAYPLMQQDVKGKPGILMRVEVQDTGLGISVEDQSKLFQEFSQVERSFTRRYGGTGLGLAISRRLINMMDGEIGVESQPGHGSKFWFMVPLQEGSASAEPASVGFDKEKEKEQSGDLSRFRILLVEDNDTNRLVARKYIEKIGFTVEEARDGQQAVNLAGSHHYDMILMDVSMPVLDGMMATQQIRGQGGHNGIVPVIALTAHAMEGDRQLCLAAGMNDYLQKPLELMAMVRVFERWLRVRINVMKDFQAGAKAASAPSAPNAGSGEAGAWSNQEPFIDGEVLRRMRDDLGGGVVEKVTNTFVDDSAQRVPVFDGKDIRAIREAAHTLKSCSGNCGLKKFSALMEALEQAASRDDKPALERLLPLVGGIYQQSMESLLRERMNFMD